ncbi:hypothetical protein ZIOFF_001253 [Zingiber officinale]|uniref:Uncharacterized protein ycf23 n=1 Tax=Zingiber officinale TaxID=94328 RepID=A0A8J5LRX1_ZINOF|nr:hypothetical protein ZIOFF_001253 [Zingiber officinale]
MLAASVARIFRVPQLFFLMMILFLQICVSSVDPLAFPSAVEAGAQMVEIGNYDSFYEMGIQFSPEQILKLTRETRRILPSITLSVTVPHMLSLPDQVKLAELLEQEGADIIQTEGGKYSSPSKPGVLGLIEKVTTATPTLAAAYSISRAVQIPVMCSSGLSAVTAPMALTAGAAGVLSFQRFQADEQGWVDTIKSMRFGGAVRISTMDWLGQSQYLRQTVFWPSLSSAVSELLKQVIFSKHALVNMLVTYWSHFLDGTDEYLKSILYSTILCHSSSRNNCKGRVNIKYYIVPCYKKTGAAKSNKDRCADDKLKKMALRVIAESLSEEEIVGLKEAIPCDGHQQQRAPSFSAPPLGHDQAGAEALHHRHRVTIAISEPFLCVLAVVFEVGCAVLVDLEIWVLWDALWSSSHSFWKWISDHDCEFELDDHEEINSYRKDDDWDQLISSAPSFSAPPLSHDQAGAEALHHRHRVTIAISEPFLCVLAVVFEVGCAVLVDLEIWVLWDALWSSSHSFWQWISDHDCDFEVRCNNLGFLNVIRNSNTYCS